MDILFNLLCLPASFFLLKDSTTIYFANLVLINVLFCSWTLVKLSLRNYFCSRFNGKIIFREWGVFHNFFMPPWIFFLKDSTTIMLYLLSSHDMGCVNGCIFQSVMPFHLFFIQRYCNNILCK